MKRLRPLVTENPEGNYQNLHNMTLIKDKQVYLRDYNGEGDLNLMEYCNRQCKEKCGREPIDAPAEEFGEYMDCDCVVSHIYHMAIGHAELRHHLGQYESFGLSPDELQERTCGWYEDEDGNWNCSKCTAVWIFPEDGPGENEMSFCPECGRKIVSISPYKEEDAGDED